MSLPPRMVQIKNAYLWQNDRLPYKKGQLPLAWLGEEE